MRSVLLVEVHEEVSNLHEVNSHVVVQGLRKTHNFIMRNAAHGLSDRSSTDGGQTRACDDVSDNHEKLEFTLPYV